MPKLTVQMLTGQVPGELDCFTSGPQSVRAVSNRLPDQVCVSDPATCASVIEWGRETLDNVIIVKTRVLRLIIDGWDPSLSLL